MSRRNQHSMAYIGYCSTVRNPHTKEHVSKVETVQRRAARYVTYPYCNISNATLMLDHKERESLEARRVKNQLTMLFKIIHGSVDIPADDYLVPASTRTRSQHLLKFLQIPVSSDFYNFSFFPRTVCRWNSLPANVAEAPSLVSFKRELFSLSVQHCLARSCKYTQAILSGTSCALVPPGKAF